VVQPKPEGLAQAYLLAEDFLAGSPSALILGDNIFFGHGLPELLREGDRQAFGATVFGYQAADPERYGVVEFGPEGDALSIVEKPRNPASNFAVTGLYFFDESASEFAKQIKPSFRGELEIVDLLQVYLQQGNLFVEKLGRGFAWFDTGTHSSLLDAGNFVRTLTERQGLQVGSPEEVAWQLGFLSGAQLQEQANRFSKSGYGRYLLRRLEKQR
jgi:glucose-1-phosphate thymidylyltransferase